MTLSRIPILMMTGILLFSGSAAHALTFDFTYTNVSNEGKAGFSQAGDRWSSHFTDNVTVNISASFAPLGTHILGSALSLQGYASYNSVKTLLDLDQSSANDAIATANLSSGSSLDFYTNSTDGARIFDNNNTNNNNDLSITTANAKALGFVFDEPSFDAEITFNETFNFDFTPEDGIGAGQYDYVGIATHEIGHALGFISGVDLVDYYYGSNLDDYPYGVVSTLDLYRFSAPGEMDLSVNTASYFSLDNGATDMGLFATGKDHGDGRQASHWKDNLGLGLMDPTFAAGELGGLSELDIVALDVIGWDTTPVPVPCSIFLLGSGIAGIIAGRRRRKNTGQ